MCLIITGKAGKVRATLLATDGLLLDIFKTNPDGIGIMYGTKEKLKIVKKLPKSLEQAQDFIARMPNDERNVAIHFRWTTHGDTNLVNCHPYVVLQDKVALMHNGVLSTGNSKDRSKSDTWHFIEDYLKKSVAMAPALPFDPGYAAMVRDFIGSNNRFVFMDAEGQLIILNKKEGIEHDGMWFSNTYAWSPKLLISDYKGYSRGTTYYGGVDVDWDYEGYAGGGHWRGNSYGGSSYTTGGGQSSGAKSGVQHNRPALPEGVTSRGQSAAPAASAAAVVSGRPTTGGTETFTQADAQAEAEWEAAVRSAHAEWQRDHRVVRLGSIGDIKDGRSPQVHKEATAADADETDAPRKDELIEALTNADVDKFDGWLSQYPLVTLAMLFHLFRAVATRWTKAEDLAAYERTIYDACIKGEKDWLIDECRRADASSSVVAEVICYYLNWLAWPEPEPTEEIGEVKTPNWVFPTSGTAEPASTAQLGQGGDDGGSDDASSLYAG